MDSYQHYVMGPALEKVRQMVNRIPEHELWKADVEGLTEQMVERVSVRPFDGDVDALMATTRSAPVDPSRKAAGVRVTLAWVELATYETFLSMTPSTSVNAPRLHFSGDTASYTTPTSEAARARDNLRSNFKQLQRDYDRFHPRLRPGVEAVVTQAVNEAKRAEEARQREIDAMVEAGIPYDPGPQTDEKAKSPEEQPPPAGLVPLLGTAQATRHAEGLLDIIDRRIEACLDLPELPQQVRELLEEEVVPLVSTLRFLVGTPLRPSERAGALTRTRTLVGKGFGITLTLGRGLSGLAGYRYAPEAYLQMADAFRGIEDAFK